MPGRLQQECVSGGRLGMIAAVIGSVCVVPTWSRWSGFATPITVMINVGASCGSALSPVSVQVTASVRKKRTAGTGCGRGRRATYRGNLASNRRRVWRRAEAG